MTMAATARGVCFVQFGDSESSLVSGLKAEFPKAEVRASPARNAPELDAWVEALDQHISQGAPRPDLPLDMRGTAFQMKVWQFLLSIHKAMYLAIANWPRRSTSPKRCGPWPLPAAKTG